MFCFGILMFILEWIILCCVCVQCSKRKPFPSPYEKYMCNTRNARQWQAMETGNVSRMNFLIELIDGVNMLQSLCGKIFFWHPTIIWENENSDAVDDFAHLMNALICSPYGRSVHTISNKSKSVLDCLDEESVDDGNCTNKQKHRFLISKCHNFLLYFYVEFYS